MSADLASNSYLTLLHRNFDYPSDNMVMSFRIIVLLTPNLEENLHSLIPHNTVLKSLDLYGGIHASHVNTSA